MTVRPLAGISALRIFRFALVSHVRCRVFQAVMWLITACPPPGILKHAVVLWTGMPSGIGLHHGQHSPVPKVWHVVFTAMGDARRGIYVNGMGDQRDGHFTFCSSYRCRAASFPDETQRQQARGKSYPPGIAEENGGVVEAVFMKVKRLFRGAEIGVILGFFTDLAVLFEEGWGQQTPRCVGEVFPLAAATPVVSGNTLR